MPRRFGGLGLAELVDEGTDNGRSLRELARDLGVSQPTAWRLQNRSRPDRPKPRGGRRPVLDERARSIVRRVAFSSNRINAVAIAREVHAARNITVSPWTVRRFLNSENISSIKCRPRPRLSKDHVSARLQWAESHADWTETNWAQVVYTDECRINLCGPDGGARAYKRRGAPLEERHTVPTVKHGGGGHLGVGLCEPEGQRQDSVGTGED
jgi:transposase